MSGSRLSSVYDFSSLRLHPDGSRVRQSSSVNLHPRYSASTVQDSRGNWFARDAAGPGTAGRYRIVKEDQAGEEINSGEHEEKPTGKKRKGKEKETSGRRHNPRPAKRQKFMNNFDFIAPNTSSDTSSSSGHPLPSSDLLKTIHHFASNYYNERGQLLNVTKAYRQKRKQNKLLRQEQQKKVEAGELEALPPAQRGGRKKGMRGKKKYPKDMYKVLDGSALVAIGMLMQEYIAGLLKVRIPDGWEDMVREADAEVEQSGEQSDDQSFMSDDSTEGDDQGASDEMSDDHEEHNPTSVDHEEEEKYEDDEDEDDPNQDEEDEDESDGVRSDGEGGEIEEEREGGGHEGTENQDGDDTNPESDLE